MKTIGNLAGLVQKRIKVPRRAPSLTASQGRKAVIAKLAQEGPPLVVGSTRLFQADDIVADPTAVMVYFALASHATKGTGIASCGQQRLAYLCDISVRTVARKLDKLKAAGLIKMEYKRPVNGNPLRRINVLRIIYDDGSMTRQDVQSIRQENGAHIGHSYGRLSNNSAHISDKAMSDMSNMTSGAVTYRTSGADHISDTAMSGNHKKHITKEQQADEVLEPDDIIKLWVKTAKPHQPGLIPTEQDHATARELTARALPRHLIYGAFCDYLLELQGTRRAPALRLRPYVAELLAEA